MIIIMRSNRKDGLRLPEVMLMLAVLIGTALLCVCVGSVNIPLRDTVRALWETLTAAEGSGSVYSTIISGVRLPRVLTVALCGAALSLSGAAMQGLLRNPLADGSTMGVSSGAALGALVALLTGFYIPGLKLGGPTVMAILFAFGSLLLILGLVMALDHTLATHSIILIGVIFSMFASSLMSLLIAFAKDKVKSLTFWTMGSFAGSTYRHAMLMLGALVIFGGILLCLSQELNAFAMDEQNAANVGVPVKKVKIAVLVCCSALIGTCVSIGGSIGFVGLVVPHICRMMVGPNHKRLLPFSLAFGAVFLMLTDLVARTLLSPVELPVGVVTSLIGSVFFVVIFYRTRKER